MTELKVPEHDLSRVYTWEERSPMWSWPKVLIVFAVNVWIQDGVKKKQFWLIWIQNTVTYQFCSVESACQYQSPPTPEQYGSSEWSMNRGCVITGPLPAYVPRQILSLSLFSLILSSSIPQFPWFHFSLSSLVPYLLSPLVLSFLGGFSLFSLFILCVFFGSLAPLQL